MEVSTKTAYYLHHYIHKVHIYSSFYQTEEKSKKHHSISWTASARWSLQSLSRLTISDILLMNMRRKYKVTGEIRVVREIQMLMEGLIPLSDKRIYIYAWRIWVKSWDIKIGVHSNSNLTVQCWFKIATSFLCFDNIWVLHLFVLAW